MRLRLIQATCHAAGCPCQTCKRFPIGLKGAMIVPSHYNQIRRIYGPGGTWRRRTVLETSQTSPTEVDPLWPALRSPTVPRPWASAHGGPPRSLRSLRTEGAKSQGRASSMVAVPTFSRCARSSSRITPSACGVSVWRPCLQVLCGSAAQESK